MPIEEGVKRGIICSETTIIGPQIISEFDIRKFRYLVISLGKVAKRHRTCKNLSSFLNSLCISNFLEVDRFEIGNRVCVIIETELRDESSKNNPEILLTGRELEIATWVARGCPNKQIAKNLHISEWTVATHIRRIFAKLGVDSRAAMVYQCANWIQK